MSIRFAGVTALAAVLLGGCTTVGPDYALPAGAAIRLPAANGAFAGTAGNAVSSEAVIDHWWQLFDDPVLEQLVDEALVTNTDLRVAAANLARAEAIDSEAAAAGHPRLVASAAVERTQLSGESYLLPVRLPDMNVADVGTTVAYQVDLVGRLRRASEAATADREATAAALEVARITVIADVARAYVAACAAGYERATALALVGTQESTLSVVSRLADAGRGTDIDVTRARALLDQQRAVLPTYDARQRAALYRLAVLTGKPPTEFPGVVAACAELPRVSRTIPVGDGAALLRRRPDVRQAERMLASATARIGVATAALYPSISIGLGGGSTGLLADLGEPATNHWSIGTLISWTMPDGRERARIRQADATAAAALAHFDAVVLNALRETETALSVYASDLERNQALRTARDEAARADEEAQRLYRAGRHPYLSALDARRTLDATEDAVAASDVQLTGDRINLFLALGGGWEPLAR